MPVNYNLEGAVMACKNQLNSWDQKTDESQFESKQERNRYVFHNAGRFLNIAPTLIWCMYQGDKFSYQAAMNKWDNSSPHDKRNILEELCKTAQACVNNRKSITYFFCARQKLMDGTAIRKLPSDLIKKVAECVVKPTCLKF